MRQGRLKEGGKTKKVSRVRSFLQYLSLTTGQSKQTRNGSTLHKLSPLQLRHVENEQNESN